MNFMKIKSPRYDIYSYLEKWRERHASCSTVCWLIKMAGKCSNSFTVLSPVKMAGKSNIRSTVCSRVYQNGGKHLSVASCLFVHQNDGENPQVIQHGGKFARWTFVCSPVKTARKIQHRVFIQVYLKVF